MSQGHSAALRFLGNAIHFTSDVRRHNLVACFGLSSSQSVVRVAGLEISKTVR